MSISNVLYIQIEVANFPIIKDFLNFPMLHLCRERFGIKVRILCSPPAAARARRAAESGSCGLGAGRGDELTGARRRLMDITTRPTTCSRGFLKGQSREIVSSFEPTRANDQQFKICSIMVKIWVSYSNLKFGKNYSPGEIDSPGYHQTMASQFLPRVSDSGDMDLPGYPTPGRLPWQGIKSRGHWLFNI